MRRLFSIGFIMALLLGGSLGAMLGGVGYGVTYGTWSDAVTIDGDVITNGDLDVVNVGQITVTGGARSGLPSWGEDKSTDACVSPNPKPLNQPSAGASVVRLGAFDKTVALSVPVKLKAEGNNMVAIASVEVDIPNFDGSSFEISDWHLLDSTGKEVTQVTTGDYTVVANTLRTAQVDGYGNYSSNISNDESHKGFLIRSVTVKLNQKR